MTLENKVLESLSEWHPAPGRQHLNIPIEGAGWTVALTADRCDELGILLWEMTVRRTGNAPESTDLPGWANQTAARATGLLEALKVIEIDTERREALLRSAVPTVRGDKRLYYEVLLKNTTEAVFRRYQGTPAAEPRNQVTFAMTHEALARLAANLTADE